MGIEGAVEAVAIHQPGLRRAGGHADLGIAGRPEDVDDSAVGAAEAHGRYVWAFNDLHVIDVYRAATGGLIRRVFQAQRGEADRIIDYAVARVAAGVLPVEIIAVDARPVIAPTIGGGRDRAEAQ